MKKLLTLTALVVILAVLLVNNGKLPSNDSARSIPPGEVDIELYTHSFKVLSVEIVEVGLWSAIAKIEYHHGPNRPLSLTADAITDSRISSTRPCTGIGPWVKQSRPEEPRKDKIRVMRPFEVDKATTSTQVEFKTWHYCGAIRPAPQTQETFTVDLSIDWEALPTATGENNGRFLQGSAAPTIALSTNVNGHEQIAKSLIQAGYPRNAISIRPAEENVGEATLEIQGYPSRETLQTLLTEIFEYQNSIDAFPFIPDSSSPAIFIHPNNISNGITIDADGFRNLAKNTSEKDFFEALGLPWKNDTERAKAIVANAKSLLDAGGRSSRERAKELLDKAASLNANIPEFQIETARYYMKNNDDFSENNPSATGEYVLQILKDAAANHPNSADVFVLLGYVQAIQNQYESARTSFETAKTLDTDNLWLWNNWGLLYRKLNDDDKAIAMYAIAADKNNVIAKNRNAYATSLWEITKLLGKNRRYAEAEHYYNKHHASIPDYYGCIYRNHANMIIESKADVDRAIQLALTSINEGCSGQSTLSMAYYIKWFNELAISQKSNTSLLAQARVSDPDQGKVLYRLAASENGKLILQSILEHGGAINLASDGNNALTHALWSRDHASVELLVALGADPTVTPRGGTHPLAIAVVTENVESIKLFIRKGVDPDTVDIYGMNIFDLASQSGNSDLTDALKGPASSGI